MRTRAHRTTVAATLAAVATVLTLTACGSSDTGASTSPAATPSATAASPSTSPSASTSALPSGGAATGAGDDAWVERFKTVVPGLSGKDNATLIAAGKQACATFTATPDHATAKALIADAESTFGLDSVGANMWLGGAFSHFCDDQSTAFMSAAIG